MCPWRGEALSSLKQPWIRCRSVGLAVPVLLRIVLGVTVECVRIWEAVWVCLSHCEFRFVTQQQKLPKSPHAPPFHRLCCRFSFKGGILEPASLSISGEGANMPYRTLVTLLSPCPLLVGHDLFHNGWWALTFENVDFFRGWDWSLAHFFLLPIEKKTTYF